METKTVGDYQILKQIGQGTLGAVFLAEHKYMKKQFVIKLLPPELAHDRGFIHRFESEVTALAQLDHPNIVRIHNISFSQGSPHGSPHGASSPGGYFLVTDCIVDDFAETTNLAQYLLTQVKKPDEEQIYRWLMQIADALDYAHHKKNVVHRGLKLNNVLVGKGKAGHVELYLTDFGLTKIIGMGLQLTKTYKSLAELQASIPAQAGPQPSAEGGKVNFFHSFLQSYLFLAPEQKRSDLPLEYHADTFSFGILAYYLLMEEFPEGIFSMPSERYPNSGYDWDRLIRETLQNQPERRPKFLVQLMEAIVGSALREKSSSDSKEESLRPLIHTSEISRPTQDHDPAKSIAVDSVVKTYVPENKEDRDVKPLLTDMVVIKGGEFSRGSMDGNRDEMPRHKIFLRSYAIDVHPVTNEQFVRFLEAMGGEKDANYQDIIRMRDSRIKRSAGKWVIESGYGKHPVVGVTWYGAVAYAKWVGKRLPTEAEWEIAARGGMENYLYPTGDDIEKSQANFFSSDTISVMSYAPNEFGLYDMGGNVYEWVQDWYGYNYYEISVQEPENPQGPIQGVYRVLRGGCWKSLKEDLRCSRRHRNNPGTVNGTYGFRCAAEVRSEARG